MTVVDRDYGYDELLETIGRLGKVQQASVLVGLRAQTGSDLATYAAANEFGVPGRIPERSFLRSTVDANQRRYVQILEVVADRLVAGEMPDRALGIVGMTVVGDVQRTIRNRVPPPNAPYTIALKGSDVPLIDTGRLRQSIDYVVEVK